MNANLVAKYILYLRKQHGFTQEELAEKLQVSRQAVSHWECGVAMPDVAVLLKLSKLYEITINKILEPEVVMGKMESFEDLQTLSQQDADMIKTFVSIETLVKSYMGTSPENAKWMEKQWKEIDFPAERTKIGRIKISDVEDAQKEIISFVNLFIK